MVRNRTRARLTNACAPFLLALCVANHASADDADLPAREHFERGVEATRQGDLELALRHFEQADQKSPNQTVRYNLGQTYTALGRPVEAVAVLQRYLAEDEPSRDRERRAEVEEVVRRNERRIGMLTVRVTPAGATVAIDARPVETTATEPLRLASGRHFVTASYPGFRTETLAVEVTPGAATETLLELERDGVACSSPSQRDAEVLGGPTPAPVDLGAHTDQPPARDRTLRILMYGSGAAGIVFAAGGLALHLHNSERYEDFQRDQRALSASIEGGSAGAREAREAAALNQRAADIRGLDDLSLAAGVFGAALMATSVVLFVFTRDADALDASAAAPVSFRF